MPERMLVSLGELEEMLATLVAHIRKQSGDEINLDADYYWDVPLQDWTSLEPEPPALIRGQLSDDLAIVREMLSPEGIPVGVGLVARAALLRRTGQIVPT